MSQKISNSFDPLKLAKLNLDRFDYDFTKRQNLILAFISSLSLLMGKKEAIIPRYKDFEACGISATKIKEELDKLIKMNVIFCNPKLNSYSINLNMNEWVDVPNKNIIKKRREELYNLNLRHKHLG